MDTVWKGITRYKGRKKKGSKKNTEILSIKYWKESVIKTGTGIKTGESKMKKEIIFVKGIKKGSRQVAEGWGVKID